MMEGGERTVEDGAGIAFPAVSFAAQYACTIDGNLAVATLHQSDEIPI